MNLTPAGTFLKVSQPCKHQGEKLIKLIDAVVNCETTILVCADCDTPLEPAKTDCS